MRKCSCRRFIVCCLLSYAFGAVGVGRLVWLWLKQTMIEKRLRIPYDSQLIAELNTERYELTKDGKTRFSHPEGTHDDRFWALALATYATRTEQTPKLWVIAKHNQAKAKLNALRQRLQRHKTEDTKTR